METSKSHLTYCTNIHAGENWPQHFAAIQQNFPAIKQEVLPNAPMGIGLRLSNIASLELVKKEELKVFKQWLKVNNAYVFTINGFPYGGFHHTRVKDQVHVPDWTTRERVDYTLRLFNILAELLPDNMDGGVSTSPLSYRYWFDNAAELAAARHTATQNILEITEHLINIYKATGKILHLDIEPEPDGIMETGVEFIDWFQKDLLVAGTKRIATTFSVSEDEAEKMIKTHVCLCYDICHFAIGYEPHAEIIKQLDQLGIKVGKIQISAALKAVLTDDTSYRLKVKSAFIKFNEPTYLHQVVACKKDSSYLRYRDLPEALEDVENPSVKEWRAHFHVPVFEKDFGLLQSTQGDICEVLKIQKKQMITSHLEVETYTWEVLPEALKLPMQKSISRELQWVANQLS
ncbi:metabolite traffic protein EboE [Segetibacter koreensis]|uniref:metabolite traffic protein EboE n=1 Tax=Segetibacter koreensis TaxID=398037 RepID=UPI00036D9409|nr:metabolite traffic protein EboE [Segetibacter koreensis]